MTVDSLFTIKDIVTVAADGTQSSPLEKPVTVNDKGQVTQAPSVPYTAGDR